MGTGVRPRGVQVLVSIVGLEKGCPSLEGVVDAAIFVGKGLGVDCLRGEGDAGDSGRRNGEALGDPYDKGEGLYIDLVSQ